jgi:hypothetical protein
MKKTLWCIALTVSLLPRLAAANDGRSEALGDNPMIRDDVDVADLPGLLTTYGNEVFLSVAQNATTGDVGAIFGRRYALGLWVHRTPRFEDLAATDELFGSFTLPQTHHLVDLLFGMDNGFGLRLSVSAGLDSDEVEDTELERMVSTGGSTLGLDLQLGYSIDRDRYHGDFGLGCTVSWFEVIDHGQTLYETGWHPSAFLRHRSEINPRTPLSWVIDVMAARRGYSAVALGDPATDGWFGRWVLSLVGGPHLSLPQGLDLWIGATFQLERLGGEVDEQEQPSLTGLGPGILASAELAIREIFFVRASARYDVHWTEADIPATTDTLAGGEQQVGQRFQWATGVGVEVRGFRIDGTISQALLLSGPQFIGGGAPGLMGTVSASYAW